MNTNQNATAQNATAIKETAVQKKCEPNMIMVHIGGQLGVYGLPPKPKSELQEGSVNRVSGEKVPFKGEVSFLDWLNDLFKNGWNVDSGYHTSDQRGRYKLSFCLVKNDQPTRVDLKRTFKFFMVSQRLWKAKVYKNPLFLKGVSMPHGWVLDISLNLPTNVSTSVFTENQFKVVFSEPVIS